MSKPTNSKDTPSAISSQGSESGAQHSDSPASPILDLFGAVVAPAKDTALQATAKARTTTETYGRYLPPSSGSEALQKSMENKLRQLLATGGSTVYEQTLKRKITPSGVSYLEHTARAPTTSGSDCGGWHTPEAHERTFSPRNCGHGTVPLANQAEMAGWATPRTVTGGAESADRKKELGRTDSGGGDLQSQAEISGYPTPNARDWKGCNTDAGLIRKDTGGIRLDQLDRVAEKCIRISGVTPDGINAGMERPDGYRLNPGFSLWLMLGPKRASEWLHCAELAMQSISARRQCLSRRTTQRKRHENRK